MKQNTREFPDKKIALKSDLYKMQRRPMHPQIVINDGYQGIKIIAPWSEEIQASIPFTKGYNSQGVIKDWCFRADGKAVLILNDESRAACWLSLEVGNQSYDVECPPLRRIMDLRYLWDEDSLWLTGGKSYNFFKLQWHEDIPVFVSSTAIESRRSHREWNRTLDRLSPIDCNVLRVESDRSQMLYHNFAEHPGKIGVANWRDETVWSITAPQEVPRLAAFSRRLFVMHEYEVHCFNEHGELETVYPAPQDFHYRDLDTIPAQSGYPPALVLGCSSLNDPEFCQILVYRIEN